MATYDGYLRSNMSSYKYADEARKEIIAALRQYPELRPMLENFTFADGQTKQLIALNGTIPVTHKGSTYNIPVCLYMQPNTPHDPPMVYVKPTQTMEIRVSQSVDPSGKIYLPYLSSWRYPQSDLLGLIQILQIQFGENTPVVSRPSRPQHPPPQHQQQPPPSAHGTPGSYGWNPNLGWGGHPTYPQQQPQQQYGYQQYPQQQPPQQQQQQQAGQNTRQDFNEEAVRQSVLSAVEDKLRRRYNDKRAQLQAELDVVRRTGQDLNEGKDKLNQLLMGLENEQNELTSYKSQLLQKNSEAVDLLAQLSSQEEVSVDDAVDATAPLYRQIVRCYTEDQALEDTMFALGDALKRNSINIDDYLKNIRELSRRQYLARATLQAGRLKAGLPEV